MNANKVWLINKLSLMNSDSNIQNPFIKGWGIRILFFIAGGLFILSCSPERKMANAFVNAEHPRSALLLAPQFLFKENLKKEVLDSLNIKDESLFDSVLIANSQVLQFVDDSMFIANYILGFNTEFKKFGFLVYREDFTADFMEMDSNAYVVNIAQILLEEAYYTERDDISIYGTSYYHDHILSAAYVSSWIEVSEINSEKENHDVYFASDIITDELKGEFTYDYFSDEVKYLYELDTLKYNDLYNFAFLLGRTYASYTFDLLLNKYLDDNLPEKDRSENYYRYNPSLDNLFDATDDKFIRLDD